MTLQSQIVAAPYSSQAGSEYLNAVAMDALALYRNGAEIYGQGEEAGPLYAVEFGCVRIGRFTSDGKRQVCGFCFAGDVFGWESGEEHQFFAEAVGSCGIRVLRPHRDEQASTKLLPMVIQSLARLQEHVILLGYITVDERLAAFLHYLAERQGHDRYISLPMQRTDIADYLGVSSETVSRILRRFKDRGLIRLPDIHSVEIVNRGALARIFAH